MLAVGARDDSAGPDWGAYTVDEVALRHGVGVEQETTDAANAGLRPVHPTRTDRYRDGWGYPTSVPTRVGALPYSRSGSW